MSGRVSKDDVSSSLAPTSSGSPFSNLRLPQTRRPRSHQKNRFRPLSLSLSTRLVARSNATLSRPLFPSSLFLRQEPVLSKDTDHHGQHYDDITIDDDDKTLIQLDLEIYNNSRIGTRLALSRLERKGSGGIYPALDILSSLAWESPLNDRL